MRHSRYNEFRRHYRLIVQSKLRITPAPSKPNKIRTEDSMHKDTT